MGLLRLEAGLGGIHLENTDRDMLLATDLLIHAHQPASRSLDGDLAISRRIAPLVVGANS
jgi:hypothetical protein